MKLFFRRFTRSEKVNGTNFPASWEYDLCDNVGNHMDSREVEEVARKNSEAMNVAKIYYRPGHMVRDGFTRPTFVSFHNLTRKEEKTILS